jgi:hypothetical protein
MSDFHGEPTCAVENDYLQLECLANSARIVRFSLRGKPNLFADLGDSQIQTPFGRFYFRGGHRLWHAPESMPRSYVPDNEGAIVHDIANGIRIEMPPESWTHIAKIIEIQLNPGRPEVILHHELRNEGAWTVELAPWALTMLRLGGVGIFPQPVENVDDAGFLPNRRLSLWPYTRLDDPRLTLRDDFLLIYASPKLPPIKLGYFNPQGWLGYWLDGVLFVKRFDARADTQYPDHECNSEIYCNDQFVELESLGPLEQIGPGQTVHHSELWELYESLDVPFIPAHIKRLVTQGK